MFLKKVSKTALSMALMFSLVIASAPVSEAGAVSAAADTTSLNEMAYEELLAGKDYVEGEVVAYVGKTAKATKNRLAALKRKGYETEELMTLSGDTNKLKKASADATPNGGSIVLIKDETKTTKELLKELSGDSSVLYAEPNYVKTIDMDDETAAEAAEAVASQLKAADEEPAVGTGPLVTDDASDATSAQYAYSTSGSHYYGPDGKKNDPSMHITNWNQDGGNMDKDVIVAVIDSGIDWTHPEFAGKIVTFTEEQQQVLGCGKYGYNAFPDESGAAMDDTSFFAENMGSHGTHCAGIVGAAWDKKGISGAASRARLVNIRAIDGNNELSTSSAVRAYAFIKKAYELGIKTRITSNSWFIDESSRIVDTVIRDVGESCGILSFIASGNDSTNLNLAGYTTTMLQSNPYVVIVGATDICGNITYFSNYSRTAVDIFAPGEQLLSTLPFANTSYDPFYYADLAPKGSNVFYAGGDSGDDLKLDIEGFDAQFSVTDVASFSGKTCYEITSEKDVNTSDHIVLTSVAKKLNKPSDFVGGGYRLSMVSFSPKNSYDFKISFKNTTGGWTEAPSCAYEYSTGRWLNNEYELPSDTDFESFQFRLELIPYRNGNSTLYLDSIGIGNQRCKYYLSSGTSMACPAAAGAAAVMLAPHLTPDSEYADGYDAKQLKADVIGSTRRNDNLENRSSTSGILDLSVKKADYCPSIAEAELSGDEFTLSGYYFGETPGAVSVTRMEAGTESKASTQIKKWTDNQVVVSVDCETTGKFQFEITAANGRNFFALKQFETSAGVFENKLSLPTAEDKPYEVDVFEDEESEGPLLALDGKLYFLQETVERELCDYVHHIRIYDIAKKKWSIVEMKEPLENVSAVVYGKKLLIEGVTMKKDSAGLPMHDAEGVERIYLYDPKASTWKKVSGKNASVSASLAATDDGLYLVGNRDDKAEPNLVCTYDINKGASAKAVAKLSYSVNSPRVATLGDNIYVLATAWLPGDAEASYYEPSGFFERVEVKKKKCENLTALLPWFATLDYDPNFLHGTDKFSLTPVNGGIVIAGVGDDYGRASVWLFNEKKGTLTKYKKQISDSYTMGASIVAYDGQLYAIATDANEANRRIFRSTAIDTLKPVASKAKLSPAKKTVKRGKSYQINVKNTLGQTVSYSVNKAVKKKGISVGKKGKIKVRKNAKTGRYTITVKVAKTEKYKAKTLKFKLTVKK